jgi:large subunit ribosomal protein L24
MRIRKGDEVEVLIGKDRTKRGTVMRVLPKDGTVIVDGINRAKKHQRQTQVRVKGGIIDKDMPISASSVALVCPKDGAVRVAYEFKEDGTKVRVCKRCGREL